jgi:hypothetical protein
MLHCRDEQVQGAGQSPSPKRHTESSRADAHSVSLAFSSQQQEQMSATPKLGAQSAHASPHLPSPEQSESPDTFIVSTTRSGNAQASEVTCDAPFPDAAPAQAKAEGSAVTSPRSGGESPHKAGDGASADEAFADRMMAFAAFGTQAAADAGASAKPRGRSSERGRKGLRSVSQNAHAIESMSGDSDGEMDAAAARPSVRKSVNHRLAHS